MCIEKNFNHDEMIEEYPLYKYFYDYLLKTYGKPLLDVKEIKKELQIGSSSFNKRKKHGRGLPCYIQNPDIEKSQIYFPLPCVAMFLSKDLVRI